MRANSTLSPPRRRFQRPRTRRSKLELVASIQLLSKRREIVLLMCASFQTGRAQLMVL